MFVAVGVIVDEDVGELDLVGEHVLLCEEVAMAEADLVVDLVAEGLAVGEAVEVPDEVPLVVEVNAADSDWLGLLVHVAVALTEGVDDDDDEGVLEGGRVGVGLGEGAHTEVV